MATARLTRGGNTTLSAAAAWLSRLGLVEWHEGCVCEINDAVLRLVGDAGEVPAAQREDRTV